MKKRKPQPHRSLRVKKDTASAKDNQHYYAVLIEGLRSDFKMLIEKLDGMEARINQRFDETARETEENFKQVGIVLSHHSRLLEQNEQRWENNDKRLDRIETTLARHDKKFDDIDRKLDTLSETLAEHDQIRKQRTA